MPVNFTGNRNLLAWNKGLAIVYGLEALAILLLGSGKTFPVGIHFLGVDGLLSQAAGHTIYTQAFRPLFDLPLAQVLALCLAVSAAIHAMLSNYVKDLYIPWLEQGSNPLRWLDNAFSASLLPLAIALVAGVSSITMLLAIFILGFVSHILALLLDVYNRPYSPAQPIKDWRLFIVLTMTATTAWLMVIAPVIAGYLFGDGLPVYISLTLLTALVFVVAIGWLMINSYRRRSQGKPEDYRKFELSFMLLSFAAKSIIAWELFVAVLMQS